MENRIISNGACLYKNDRHQVNFYLLGDGLLYIKIIKAAINTYGNIKLTNLNTKTNIAIVVAKYNILLKLPFIKITSTLHFFLSVEYIILP